MTDGQEVLVRLSGIVKRFGTFTANDRIDLTVRAGSVHAVVGENGAGKSTLMKILSGEESPDEGTIEIDGAAVTFRSPRDAQAAGIGIVHQHFLLAPALRVWENVVLADEPGPPVLIDAARARREVGELAERTGFPVPVDAETEDLGVGTRQRVEILKVLYRDARIIILDEPTAVLVPAEAEALFAAMRDFTSAGAAVIFISHKLDEVLSFADDITVIRAGRVVGTAVPAETTASQLARLMVASEMPVVTPRESPVSERVVLETRGLTVAGTEAVPLLSDVAFRVHAGEIVGVAGVEGNGQSELLAALIGRADATGTVLLDGDDVSAATTVQRRARGMGYISEDRHRDGIVLPLSLRDNAVLGYQQLAPVRRGPWFSRAAAAKAAAEIIAAFDVRGGGPATRAATLSGGNQQKFIVGRELLRSPRLLLAAHPTRGVDIGAQAAIWSELTSARDRGLATLLVSADLDEILALSDRILVLHRGRIVAELDARGVDAGTVGEYMTGARGGEEAA
ncbi:simple sugar transport system ATP-binding protein [Microbacterium sp. ru370.1]|uniref:ABC transporter ATP-binding protein n=1 Tax=unclassified Microbacterium TaxID=2609290 RepID=UPI00087F5150|nr:MULTISPECIES: ABC transporter ATP-binding protein [unclassified Microbacterium]SDO83975.1 simple sugar transport system ATP-binding protein [Microbacterium sp. ru370.1]SIT90291.1 simple sugar transport system ATP-binding protein [Microbacterium sp. RU1D]